MPANPVVSPSTLEDLAIALAGGAATKPADVDLAAVRALGLKPLQDVARALGLTGISRLKKEALVEAVWEAWQVTLATASAAHAGMHTGHTGGHTGSKSNGTSTPHRAGATGTALPAVVTNGAAAGPASPPLETEAEPGGTNAVAPVAHKYEVGRPGETPPREAVAVIPWGYGRDRVTAMPVDPDRLFVYWEVLDDSMARARAALGPGGQDAWLNLRVYDVTGRIFDGTNAHEFFDQGIDRSTRQWFFTLGKPTSEVVVEIGMRARDGAFAKVARSGRVEFPRRDPVGWAEPEWLTVRNAGAEVVRAWMPPSSHPSGDALAGGGGAEGLAAGDLGPGGAFDGGPSVAWDVGLQIEGPERVVERIEWEEVHVEGTATEVHRRITWEEHSTITSWQEGPFTYPVEVPAPVFESFVGKTRVFRSGPRTRVVYGPWQVLIRGLGATSASQVISRWEVYRSWAEDRGSEISGFSERVEMGDGEGGVGAGGAFRKLGASELLGGSERRMVGASERRWRGSSELRLGGASEIHMIGASERRLMGASELSFVGASERMRRGASERRLRGASEYRLGGASERRLGGASEERLGGASERRLGGGSENRFLGASENMAQRGAATGPAAAPYPWPDAGRAMAPGPSGAGASSGADAPRRTGGG